MIGLGTLQILEFKKNKRMKTPSLVKPSIL
jgi:hypothetical protein